MSRTIHVLYGSQTGNAEDIAKSLCELLMENGLPCQCQDLNSIKKLDMKTITVAMIIVCSTTGNGDSPENADQWWRSIKIRSIAKDTFSSIPYSVLGLGDTNYDKFCHMGKSIDKRLGELGGHRLLELYCADEAVGLEDTVEKWKKDVTSCLLSITRANDKNSKIPETLDECADIMDVEKCCESIQDITIDCEVCMSQSLPAGVMDSFSLLQFLEASDKCNSPPLVNTLPRIKNLCANLFTFVTDTLIEQKESKLSHFPDDYTVDNPFLSTVLSAEYLTSMSSKKTEDWSEIRRVVSLQLDLNNSRIEYQPGDSIGICCPNPEYVIQLVFKRLQSQYKDISLESLVYDASSKSHLSLRDILTYKFDLTGPPKKATVTALAKYCSDARDLNFMLWLSSKTDFGKLLWSSFIEDQQLGVGEMLELIPSCSPPLDILLSCLSPLPPRFYSIASSQLSLANAVSVAFSVVHYTCQIKTTDDRKTPVLRRLGVCTSFLESLLQPWLSPSRYPNPIKPTTKIKIFHKPTINFRLPGSSAHPLILIGPGTGVAPFIGFLEHRERCGMERARSGGDISTGVWRGGFEIENLPYESGYVGQYIQSVASGPIYLFHGCRTDDDFLFKQFLNKKLEEGVLTSLDVAMSRKGSEKVYVTHLLECKGLIMYDLIINQGAYVYICGDGNKMAKDVNNVFCKIFEEHGKMSSAEAQNFLDDLRQRRRYLVDIWS